MKVPVTVPRGLIVISGAAVVEVAAASTEVPHTVVWLVRATGADGLPPSDW